MQRLTVVIILLCVAGVACSPAAAQEVPTEEEREGVTTPVTPETETEVLSEAESVIDAFDPDLDDPIGVTDPLPDDLQVHDNVVRLHTGDGSVYVVTDAEPGVAGATVTGYDLQVIGADSQIFVATDVTTSTEGSPVEPSALFESPGSYEGELVRVEIDDYNQAVVAAHALEGSVSAQYTVGVQANATLPFENGTAGLSDLDAMLDETTPEVTPVDRGAHLDNAARALDVTEHAPIAGLDRHGYAGSASATLDVAVTGDAHRFYVAGQQWHATDASITAVVNGSHDGEVVSVEGARATSRLSIKETVETVANCGPDWFGVPSVGCVPGIVDVVVHAGVLADGAHANASAVPIVGVSNAVQTSPVETVHDRARVTGRVVDTDDLHVDVPGPRAIVVLDAERTGDAGLDEGADEVREWLEEDLRADVYRSIRGLETVSLPASNRTRIVASWHVRPTTNVSEPVNASVGIENDGWTTWNGSVWLRNESATLRNTTLSIEAGQAAVVDFGWTPRAPGNHTLEVDGDGLEPVGAGTVTVQSNETDGAEDGDETEEEEDDSDDSSGPSLPPPGSGSSDDSTTDDADDSDENKSNDGGDEEPAEESGPGDSQEPETEPDPGDGTDPAPRDEADDVSEQSDDGSDTESASEEDALPGFGVIATIVALLGAAMLAGRRA